MPDAVVIVCLPPNPLRFEALRPCTHAAALAAHLHGSGVESQILDFATVETFDRLAGPGSPVWKVRRSKQRRARDIVQPEPIDLSSPDELAHVYSWFSSRLGRKLSPSASESVVFIVRDAFGWKVADLLQDSVRAEGPDSRDIAIMDVSSEAASARMWVRKGNDWLGSLELSSFAELWPCFAGMRPGRSRAAGYHPTRYAALEDETKLRVFEIGDDAESTHDEFGLLRAVEECNTLYRDHRTRAFQLNRSVAHQALDRIAQELTNRRLGFLYCVHAGMRECPPALAQALATSGCVAARIDVPSGSQRLLDTVYDAGYCITDAVNFLRAAATSGIHTGVTVRYPSPDDDFHTADETIRFLRRAAPHVAEIVTPRAAAKQSASTTRRIARDRNSMQATLDESGMGTVITPWEALIAALAGYAGREQQFLSHVDFLLCSGDIVALGEIVEGINRNAHRGVAARYWSGDEHGERVVGN